jgi:trk system potassium uptake protein TrkA
MEIIVVGCGRVGAELALRLFRKGHTVAVVDEVLASFHNLHPDFRGRTIEGEALNQGVLQRAGIESADGFAAVTSSDALNVAAAHLARSIYNVPNVVARNYDPGRRALYEAFDLQVVSSSSWGAQRIEELLYHREMRTVFSAGNGEVEIYEFTVPEKWAGQILGALLPARDCLPAALTRAGKALLPQEDVVLQPGDVVLVSATMQGIEELRSQLKRAWEV